MRQVSEGVLRFPYIRLSSHDVDITRLLLYWDDVATIVPDMWMHGSEEERNALLGEFTHGLLKAGVVVAAVPTYELAGSLAPFTRRLEALDPAELARRRQSLESEGVLVHKGKFAEEGVKEALRDLGLLAEPVPGQARAGEDWMWFRLDPTTTAEFMATLAVVAGSCGDGVEFWSGDADGDLRPRETARKQRVPGTAHPLSLAALTHNQGLQERSNLDRELEAARLHLLEQLFPAPQKSIDAEWLSSFKKQHGDRLIDFRLKVERRIFDAIRTTEAGPVRTHEIRLIGEELSREVERIEGVMVDSGVRRIEKTAFAVLENVPGIGRLFKAARDIADQISADPLPRRDADPDLAYGFFAQRALQELGSPEP